MLKLRVENLEGIDTSLHGFYEESDDGYKLKIDGEFPDISKLESTLKKVRDESKEYKTKLSELEKSRDEIERQKLESEGKYKELSAKDREERLKYETDFKNLEKEIASSKRDLMLRQFAVSMTSDELYQENIINAMIVKNVIKIEGKEVSFIKDPEDLKKDFAKYVLSKATGTNDKGNNSDGGSKTFKDMTESERVELYRKNPEEYRRLAGTK